MSSTCCGRRDFLRTSVGVGAVGLSGLALSACGSGDDQAAETPPTHEGSTWHDLMDLEDLPVGEAASAQAGDHGLLVHRTAEEEVQVFSDICTHEGCTVTPEVEQERFRCPCHDSVYGLTDGVPFGGPAREPLTRFTAEVAEGRIRVMI